MSVVHVFRGFYRPRLFDELSAAASPSHFQLAPCFTAFRFWCWAKLRFVCWDYSAYFCSRLCYSQAVLTRSLSCFSFWGVFTQRASLVHFFS